MTNRSPSDPGSSRRSPLGFDEFIAILVAFSAIGAVLFWGLSRNQEAIGLLEGSPSPSPSTSPAPVATPTPAPEAIATTPAPGATLTPSPSPASPGPAAVETYPGAAVVPAPATPTTPPAAAPPLAAVAPLLVVAAPDPNRSAQFTDVPADYWARPYITDLAQRGILTGFPDGTFQPEKPVTRAEFATLIEKIFAQTGQQQPIAFSDVPANYWAAPAVDEAVKTGFLRGYPEGNFLPNQPITKAQTLVSLVSGLKVPPASIPSSDILNRFADGAQTPAYAQPAVAAATQAGLVVNHPDINSLSPNQPATRAEVAAIIYQALTAAGKVPPIQSSYVVRP